MLACEPEVVLGLVLEPTLALLLQQVPEPVMVWTIGRVLQERVQV